MINRTLQINKIISKSTFSYLKVKLPQPRNHFLVHVFSDVRCRTNRYSSSFFPDATKLWNIFISQFEHFPTFSSFKKFMINCHRPVGKSVFGIHDPMCLRYLFQLRLRLSSLRSHKVRYGFADTPSDTCLCKRGAEDSRHFLLSCPFYNSKRDAMKKSVNEILEKNNLNYPANFPVHELNLFLYGDNCSILRATLKFIKETNRFSY